MAELIQSEQIEQAVLLIRGQRVMLDRDLAALYGVETKNLNKGVQRNPDHFPTDFMFQLTAEEAECLRFQLGTLKRGQHFKYLPYVFTQEGVSMLSRVLRSPRSIQVGPLNKERRFISLRLTDSGHPDTLQRSSRSNRNASALSIVHR